MCDEVADPPLTAKQPLKLLAAVPVPGQSVQINQFETLIYWVKLQIRAPINPEHVIVEVLISTRRTHETRKLCYRKDESAMRVI